MALILVKDVAPRGNADSKTGLKVPKEFCGPADSPKSEVKYTGGDAVILDTAKADGICFRPWVAVIPPGGVRQENQILRYVHSQWSEGTAPIRRLDWTNRAMITEYLDRNPDRRPTGEAGTADYVAQVAALIAGTDTPDIGPGRIPSSGDGFNMGKTPGEGAIKAALDNAPTPPARTSGGDMGALAAAGRSDLASQSAKTEAFAQAAYDAKYQEHRDNGLSENQAAYHAGKARSKALGEGAPEGDA